MAGTIADNASAAAMAFRGATEDAGNFIDSLMQQYGWTMAGPDGSYSTIAAGDAFDPNNIMSFGSDGGATVDTARIAQQTAGGQMGGKGVFSDILRTGGAEEAQAMADIRSRGLGRGGLAAQQQQLAEYTTGQRSSQASADLLKALMGQYSGVGRSYRNLLGAQVQDSIGYGQTGSQYV